MSNIKIEKYIKEEGFCCLWAFFEAKRRVYTSVLLEDFSNVCEKRALQYQRAAHRSGKIDCENNAACLRKRIKDGWITHKTVLNPCKAPDSVSSEVDSSHPDDDFSS